MQKGIYKKGNDTWDVGGKANAKENRGRERTFLDDLDKDKTGKHPRKKKKKVVRADHKHVYKEVMLKETEKNTGEIYYMKYKICGVCKKIAKMYYGSYSEKQLPEGIEIVEKI